MYRRKFNIRLFFAFLSAVVATQTDAQINSIKRYEIDLRREEMKSPFGLPPNETMLRAREFIRKDPTYYVGYMFEGFYRYDRAGDAEGYRLAISPLKKAMDLFENDYTVAIRDIYSSERAYMEYRPRIQDYVYIVEKLKECYSNIERPDSVIKLLNRYKSWNFQHDELGADNYIAWTYHRNRFYTSDKFDFLYNSVNENEMAALYFLKRNLDNINKNSFVNETVVDPMYVLASRMSVYHYLSIIYSYLHKPDSAAMYFDHMKPFNIFPHNNYAIFCFVNGSFAEAYSYFRYSNRVRYYSDKHHLRESIYYMSILDVMRAMPQKSVTDLSEYIAETGVRPGWGWYNIALGRALLYNGQLDSSLICINKAAKFNDVHIGTTWGESHYAFSHAILKLMNLQRQEAALRFEDRYYWLSPSKLRTVARLKLEQYLVQMIIFTQLSANPERGDIYYRLFASEATISFDEIFYMIKDYGRRFFIREFEKYAETDERKSIRKYFKLFQGKLQLEKGDTGSALKTLDEVYDTESPGDGDFGKLYQARLYEALALANDASGTRSNFEKFRTQFYKIYPQLVPFSRLKMKFKLKTENGDVKSAEKLLSELKSFNIDFVKESEQDIPTVRLRFGRQDNRDEVKYSVETDWGTEIVEPASFKYANPEKAAKKLAYALFNLKQ
jgi:hypothetical protein